MYLSGRIWANRKREIPDELKKEAEEWMIKLLEKVAAEDETLLDLYLEKKEIPNDLLAKVIRKLVLEYKIVPVFCGTALKNKGIQLLLDAVCRFLSGSG